MWYEKEYIFFKRIAERFCLSIYEIKQPSFEVFHNGKVGIYFPENQKGLEQFYYLIENCPEQKVICVQNKEEDIHMLFLRLPDRKERTILLLGPMHRKDLVKAHGIMVELAGILWNDTYEFEKYSFSLKQVHPLVEKVIESIEADVTGKHTLRSIAREMNVSPGHLSKLFTQEIGISLTEYVNRKKIEHGAYLLNNTDDKICCIAMQCGMPDNNYFSRLFKRYIGISPAEYRKKGITEKINR